MYRILYGSEFNKYPSVFESLFRLRYKHFIQERRWALTSRRGLEKDEYDNDEAVYFVCFSDDDVIEACARMTPTLRSSLLADYFPHLNETGEPSRSPDIYEATRYIIQPAAKTRGALRQAKAKLIVPLLEWCLSRRLSHLQAVVDFAALSAFTEMTLRTQPLGLSHPYGGGRNVPGGGDCVAFRWPITEEVLNDVVAYGRTVEAAPTFA